MSRKVFDIELIKSTKNKHVYGDEGGADVIIPSVYINKTGLPADPPQRITVTLEYE
jgi:hypothetical protein